ncbi:hypothetical protein [Paramaledivibacter caminithermalis]|nr:hypothetical protein [Paramaledivibacter caminithermalis]
MRRIIKRKYYFCMCCREWIIEDDMVSWNCKTKKGFCRECDKNFTYEEKREIEEVGFYQGEQLSFFA